MLFTFATLTNSCKALFYVPVAENFLPFNSISHDPCESFNKEDMFVSRRLYKAGDGGLARDLICTGCQLCGSPLQLYVWDEADYAPLLVKKKAAELLVENIRAERVCSCYKGKKQAGQVDSKDVPTHNSLNAKVAWQPKTAEGGVLVSCSADRDKKNSESKGKHC